MNYAELCRYTATHLRNDGANLIDDNVAAILDAAAALYELNDPVSKGSPCKCGICRAMAAADAAAKGAE